MEGEKFIILIMSWIAVFGIAAAFLLPLGEAKGRNQVRQEAIKMGVAHYVLMDGSGTDVQFVWITPTSK